MRFLLLHKYLNAIFSQHVYVCSQATTSRQLKNNFLGLKKNDFHNGKTTCIRITSLETMRALTLPKILHTKIDSFRARSWKHINTTFCMGSMILQIWSSIHQMHPLTGHLKAYVNRIGHLEASVSSKILSFFSFLFYHVMLQG